MPTRPLATYVETGQRRVFAAVVDWPGWCRPAKDAEGALEALADYRDRYAVVTDGAGIRLPAAPTFQVVERLKGNATTDFGAPGAIADGDHASLTKRAVERQLSLLQATWGVFGRVLADAPATLRKGPRGGGRDRDAIAQHVVSAEVAYARKLGLRGLSEPPFDDAYAVASLRESVIRQIALRAKCPWPVRYALRRFAWHVLDHAWEMEDKAQGDTRP